MLADLGRPLFGKVTKEPLLSERLIALLVLCFSHFFYGISRQICTPRHRFSQKQATIKARPFVVRRR